MKILDKLAKAFEWEIEGFLGKGSFTFGDHTISYDIGEKSSIVEVFNPTKGIYLDCIADYLKDLIPPYEDEYNIWDDHGFRDEADYIRYKFG